MAVISLCVAFMLASISYASKRHLEVRSREIFALEYKPAWRELNRVSAELFLDP